MNPAQRLLLRNIAAVVLVQRLEYPHQSGHRLSHLRLGTHPEGNPVAQKPHNPSRTQKIKQGLLRPRCLQLKLVLLLLLGLVLHGVFDQGRCHLAASRSHVYGAVEWFRAI